MDFSDSVKIMPFPHIYLDRATAIFSSASFEDASLELFLALVSVDLFCLFLILLLRISNHLYCYSIRPLCFGLASVVPFLLARANFPSFKIFSVMICF